MAALAAGDGAVAHSRVVAAALVEAAMPVLVLQKLHKAIAIQQ